MGIVLCTETLVRCKANTFSKAIFSTLSHTREGTSGTAGIAYWGETGLLQPQLTSAHFLGVGVQRRMAAFMPSRLEGVRPTGVVGCQFFGPYFFCFGDAL